MERILLKLGDQDVALGKRVIAGWEIGQEFTQRVFLASPSGRYLALADWKTGALRVRDRKGRERRIDRAAGRDARFSPDERHLATIRLVAGGKGETELVVLDLATGAIETTRGLGSPGWMEWVTDGVVVSHDVDSQREITYLSLEGERVKVASGSTQELDYRFTTARRGHRVMYFFQRHAHVVDTDADAEAQRVGDVKAMIENVEMAPDGSEATVADGGVLLRWRDGGELAKLDDVWAHTIWYSADGTRLAYASQDRAVVLAGDRRFVLEASEHDLAAMRFHGDDLIVSMGERALRWSPDTGARKVVGRGPKGQTVQAADLYQGGLVLWTREIRRLDRKRAKQALIDPFDPFAFVD